MQPTRVSIAAATAGQWYASLVRQPADRVLLLRRYVYLYSIHYFVAKTKMTGFFQTAFYFGYTAMFCMGLGIMCGALGYLGSSVFVRCAAYALCSSADRVCPATVCVLTHEAVERHAWTHWAVLCQRRRHASAGSVPSV